MAKAFKKKGNPTDEIPSVTNTEVVDGVTYGVADYNGRKTYFNMPETDPEKVNYYGSGANTPTPVQDSELNPHLFPGYNPKSGTIDNSNATSTADILTPSQEKKVGKAFRKEITFNKSMATNGSNDVTQSDLDIANKARLQLNPLATPFTMDQANQMLVPKYNVGEQEMLRNDQDPNNPQYASMSFVPFANNVMPGDEAFLASMRDATFAQQNFNQEEIDQNITNMMRQSGMTYDQAYKNIYGNAPTGTVPEKFASLTAQRSNVVPESQEQIDKRINELVTSGLTKEQATSQILSEQNVYDPITGKYTTRISSPANSVVTKEDIMNNPKFYGGANNLNPLPENVFMGYGATNDVRNDFRSPIIRSENYTNIKFRNEYPKTWKSTPNITIPVAQSANQTVQSVQNTTSNQSVTESLPEDTPHYTAMDWLNAGLRSNDLFGESLAHNSNRSVKSAAWSKNPVSLSRLKYDISAREQDINPLINPNHKQLISQLSDKEYIKVDKILQGIENGTLEPIEPGGYIYKYFDDGWEWYFNKKTYKRDRSLQAVDGTFK